MPESDTFDTRMPAAKLGSTKSNKKAPKPYLDHQCRGHLFGFVVATANFIHCVWNKLHDEVEVNFVRLQAQHKVWRRTSRGSKNVDFAPLTRSSRSLKECKR